MSHALVLSGGGSLGVAHIGALRVLEKKYTFDYYAGVSAGAIIGAAHACGYSADEISDLIHQQNFFALAFDSSETNFGLVRGQKILKVLDSIFGGKKFEDLERKGIKLRIYATDFQTGERVCLDSGNIALAVRASLSVPVLFDPLSYAGKFLVDGGLSGNFPMEETLNNYSGKCIGIDVGTALDNDLDFSEKSFFGRSRNISKGLEQTFRIFFKNQQTFNPKDPKIERLIYPAVAPFRTIDIHKLKEIEKVGEKSIKNML